MAIRVIAFLTLFFTSLSGEVYLGADLGVSVARLGKREPTIGYESGVLITDAYPLTTSRPLSMILNVHGGYEFTGAEWIPSIAVGLGGYFTPTGYYFKGRVVETPRGDPGSTLYNYTYRIHNIRVMAEMRCTWSLGCFSSFIDIGVGPAWNRAGGYRETAVDSTGYPPIGPFHHKTQVNFACQAGIGLSMAWRQERFSVGYRYVYSGKTKFGTRGSAYPYPLDIGSLSADEVYFGYTHLF